MLENSKLEQLKYFVRTSSATALASVYKTGLFSPTDVLKTVSQDVSLTSGIFTDTSFKIASVECERSELRYKNSRSMSLLDGIPIAIKDNFHIKGCRTKNGSATSSSVVQTKSSSLCQTLITKGLVPVAKTTMSELAFSGVGINTVFGTPENNFRKNRSYIPGGSSSGSAAAVAHGIVPLAIGSDTSGSARIPASVQGIVGYKPSSGLHEISDICPLSPTLDTAGFFSRNVADCALLHELSLKNKMLYPQSDLENINDIKLVIPDHAVSNILDKQVKEKFQSVVNTLKQAGFNITTEAVKEFDYSTDLFSKFGTLVSYEAYENYGHLLSSSEGHNLQEFTRSRLMKAQKLSFGKKNDLLMLRKELIGSISAKPINEFYIFPTVPVVNVTVKSVLADLDFHERYNKRILENTMIGSFLDMPGISIPSKLGRGQMPFGLLISSTQGQDANLLAVAKVLEGFVS